MDGMLLRMTPPGVRIVQETFISAARYIHGLHAGEKFGSWLFSIAHQKCIQRWRKRSKEETLLEEQVDNSIDDADGPLDLLIKKEQEEIFMNLLHQLPLPQRSVLLLYFVEDFSLEDIASITGAQIGTVKSRMHYAKKAFRKLYEEQS